VDVGGTWMRTEPAWPCANFNGWRLTENPTQTLHCKLGRRRAPKDSINLESD